MPDLLTAATFEARTGRTLTATQSTQIEGLITDASALVADIVGDSEITDAWDATATPLTVPASVVPVVVAMVRRGLDNPDGYASETIGSYTYRDAPQSGVFATRDEARVIRRAAGVLNVGALNLAGYLPRRDPALHEEPWPP